MPSRYDKHGRDIKMTYKNAELFNVKMIEELLAHSRSTFGTEMEAQQCVDFIYEVGTESADADALCGSDFIVESNGTGWTVTEY